ncbi:hypothetical protein AAFF_G00165840 [Aldrovandia affinis]|uniref:Small integral membrane protein 1 n=1 Tax=Aldrovandia affinis TaxID=143900 RepID=A0AAD7RMS4_9TELE|nr:hypothetical protein AAFF_G00165840 [Aldrovandia affinis]
MEASEADMQYNRWNDDNINLDVAASQSRMRRLYDRLGTGNVAIAVKVAGALAVLVVIYVIGYVTGYYVHKC